MALHVASNKGHPAVVRLLLEKGAYIHSKSVVSAARAVYDVSVG
jgi:ankyrin repeat protein